MEVKPNFSPGLKLIIEFPSIFNNKFNSIFRGFKQNQYIIIDHPIHNNLQVQLESGIVCMVRFIEAGRACGFESEIIDLAKHPYPLVFLKYPTSIESSALRSEERYPVKLNVVFSQEKEAESKNERLKGEILNLSQSGCLLGSPEPFPLDSFLYLVIPFPEHGLAVDLEGEVKNCQKMGEIYHIGLKFSDSLQPVHNIVAAYLDNLKLLRVRA
ncbi:MAG: flagellar brake protein [Deltaproteobacteria bacterium]|nr:flagellar brake protein [Deltaproteobacteria bacterium]